MTEALSKMNVDDAVERLISPTGNQLEVVKVANSALFALRFKNTGKLPEDEEVSGRFTKPELAEAAAKRYLRKFWAKVERDNKPLSSASRKNRSAPAEQAEQAEQQAAEPDEQPIAG